MASSTPRKLIAEAAIATGIKWELALFIFNNLDRLSSLMYERAVSSGGTLILANPDNNGVQADVRFASCVPLDESRWARKFLQMATSGYALLAGGDGIWGLGELNTNAEVDGQSILQVDFPDHHYWVLSRDGVPLLASKFGVPTLHQELPRDRFFETYQQIFPDAGSASGKAAKHVFGLVQAAHGQAHGSTLILA